MICCSYMEALNVKILPARMFDSNYKGVKVFPSLFSPQRRFKFLPLLQAFPHTRLYLPRLIFSLSGRGGIVICSQCYTWSEMGKGGR